MKTILLFLLSAALPAVTLAAPSGINSRDIENKIALSCEDLDSRLDSVEDQYEIFMSTPVVDPQTYADYRNTLLGTGRDVRALDEYQRSIAETVDKLEANEPQPDDIQELLSLKDYAFKQAAAEQGRYDVAEQNHELLLEKIRKQAQAAASGQQGTLNSDPQAVQQEKEHQLKIMEQARAMGDKEKEFNAIKNYAGMDPQKGRQMLGGFFDGLTPQERSKYSEKWKEDAPALSGSGTSFAMGLKAGSARTLSKPMGAAVPGIGGAASDDEDFPGAYASQQPAGKNGSPIKPNEVKLSMWTAVDKFSPSLAAPHLRETTLSIAADAKTDWLEKKQQALKDLAARTHDASEREQCINGAGNIDKLMGKKSAAAGLDNVDDRSQALGEWNTSVSRLMDKSQEGQTEKALVDKKAVYDAEYAGLKTDAEKVQWLKDHGAESDANGKKLAELYANNPEYLSARKTEADAQAYMRSNVANFKDGTSFTSDELGLQLPPGQKVVISRYPEGSILAPRGYAYKDEQGLSHFESFDKKTVVDQAMEPDGKMRVVEKTQANDGTVNIVERQPNGDLVWTEERKPDGTRAMEIYGADGKAVAAKLTKPDGSTIEAEAVGPEGIKRTIFTDANGAKTFTLEPPPGGSGYPRQSGRVVDGKLVMDRMELDPKTVKARSGDYVFETKVDGKSAGFEVDMNAIRALPENKRGEASKAAAEVMAEGNADQAGPLKQFIELTNQQVGPKGQVSVITGQDAKGNTVYQANVLSEGGSQKQIVGQWTKISKKESEGLASDTGLDISVRSAGKGYDINKTEFSTLERFSGDHIIDYYGGQSRLTGGWVTGYGAENDNYIGRYDASTGAPRQWMKTGTDKLYSSPGIIGQTGIAINAMGKSTVQLTGSAMAVVGAGTVGWADKDLQNEFMERAKSNFYGNEVSRTLGQNLIGDYYNTGYSMLKVDENRNIQNVGKEVGGTTGAVLQGGVNFANGVASSLILAPVGGASLSNIAGKAGPIGTALSKGYSGYQAVKGVYDTGASGVEFVQSYRAFNENDPASKERYYDAVTGLTTSALNSPKTLGRALTLGSEVKSVIVGKPAPSTILGADGKPYEKPPEELSSFNKFITGRNEPGALTKVMTKDLAMGAEPRYNINLANNPVGRAVESVDKWAGDKIYKMMGKTADIPKPALIVPGQTQPNPDAKIIVPGQAVPNPNAIILRTGTTQNPNAQIIVPGQAAPNPDAVIIVPGQTFPNPDAKIIVK